mmetsp:Transcript_7628/g.13885  ORF Transcript_7628/g.13885 Transcript_7628/m.13885 type:complete len:479 (-) Transcript_7628:34-1470(-)
MEQEWRRTVEYYMSEEGISRHDRPFQEALACNGCLPLSVIISWPRMKKNGAQDAGEVAVAEALRLSPLLKVSAEPPLSVGPVKAGAGEEWCRQVEFYMSEEGRSRAKEAHQQAMARDGCMPLSVIITWPRMVKNGAQDAGEAAVAEALRQSALLNVSDGPPFMVGPRSTGAACSDPEVGLLPRCFRKCCDTVHGQSLTVMQFNVLADGLGTAQFDGRVAAEVLAFPQRLAAVLREIVRVAPAILCMQEVNHYHESWKGELDKFGFDGLFIPKYASSYPSGYQHPPPFYNGKPADGCAIFIARDRLCFGKHVSRRFAELTGDHSMTQVVIAAEILDGRTGKHMCTVSTSHLKAGGGSANATMRSQQGRAWVDFLKDFGKPPYVVTGDMNESMQTSQARGVKSLCDGLSLGSAYSLGQGCDPAYTAIDGSWRSCLDYILISRDLLPLQVWEVPDLPDGAIPSSAYPSDHLALAVDLQLFD